MKYPLPSEGGFYWAKHRITDDEHYAKEFKPSDEWEIVEVFENCLDLDDDEFHRVFVLGVAHSESIENFVWGPAVKDKPPQETKH